jgi:hypothetical protein
MNDVTHDVFEGRGRLRLAGSPTVEFDVEYRFDIFSETVRWPGFPPADGDRTSRGQIRRLNNEPLPEGVHELRAEDGQTYRVKNLGFVWAILSSRP